MEVHARHCQFDLPACVERLEIRGLRVKHFDIIRAAQSRTSFFAISLRLPHYFAKFQNRRVLSRARCLKLLVAFGKYGQATDSSSNFY